jgi:hypothetical protein
MVLLQEYSSLFKVVKKQRNAQVFIILSNKVAFYQFYLQEERREEKKADWRGMSLRNNDVCDGKKKKE